MTESKPTYKKTVLKGIPVSYGVAIGNVVVLRNKQQSIKENYITQSEVEAHKQKFLNARTQLTGELRERLVILNEDATQILESQVMIAEDPEIEKTVLQLIEKNLCSADYAVAKAYRGIVESLQKNGNDFFRQRIIDIENIKNRYIAWFNNTEYIPNFGKGNIIVAKQLGPAELMDLHKKGISGLVLENGGSTSHAALLSRALGIPSIVGVEKACEIATNGHAIIDVEKNRFIINPDAEDLSAYEQIILKYEKNKAETSNNSLSVVETKSGTKVRITANLEFLAEITSIKAASLKDIGLLRTEWLYLRNHAGESEQIQFYEKVLTHIEGTVIIRLFDIGGDKIWREEKWEENPFLGLRGIRLLLAHKDILETQLSAILKTAGRNPGRVKIMLPMVTVLDEVIEVKKLVEKIQAKLGKEGFETDKNISIGIMIEVPSAAIMVEKFAKEVDFFSIGTNDLTQYVLAVDRGNKNMDYIYCQYHPAVFRLIETTYKAARRNNIEISVCGELAGTELGASALVGLGIRNLSMNSASAHKIAAKLKAKTDDNLKALADKILESESPEEIKNWYESNF